MHARNVPARTILLAVVTLAGAAAWSLPVAHGSTPRAIVRDTTGDARRGRAIVEATRDSLPRHVGNALRCTSCHLDGGSRATASAWHGVARTYPRHRARRGSTETIEQRVNECLVRSLAGRALPDTSRAMRDIVAWLDSLGRLAPLPKPDTVRLAGDTLRGARTWATACARCHGVTGAEGGSAPPVWGRRSYTVGAGLARHSLLATFVRWNMPYDGATRLDDRAAADVAAWLLRRPRLDHPGKARDWPAGDAPADVAYATDAARAAGRPLPQRRPLIARDTTTRSRGAAVGAVRR